MFADAPTLFSSTGDSASVAEEYLSERFTNPAGLVGSEPGGIPFGDLVAHRWQFPASGSSSNEEPRTGWIFVRPSESDYEVVAATTDGVSTAAVTFNGERVFGAITQEPFGQLLFADVLDLNGEPVPGVLRPQGQDEFLRFGTAAGFEDYEVLELDVAVTGVDDVVLRVNLVGGTILAVAEHGIPISAEPTLPDESPAEIVAAVPDVVGLLFDTARLALEREGLEVGIVTFEAVEEGSPDVGRVLAQTPLPGSFLTSGFSVELVVGEARSAIATEPGGPDRPCRLRPSRRQ